MRPTFTPASLEDCALAPTPVHDILRRMRWEFGDDRVAFGGFEINGGAATIDWLLQHTLEGTRYDLSPLLHSSALADALPALARGVNPDRMFNFELVEPLAVVPSLAAALAGLAPTNGGTSRVPAGTARDVATDLLDALLGDRLWRATVLASRAAWSDWFACDVWDHSWVLVDVAGRVVWLLCLSSPPPPRFA
ncbi:MAG: hypothetical protein IT306_14285 [Chloroflexi bacterium]|nr:hypothetical protein [Chloroflexota bacterium]